MSSSKLIVLKSSDGETFEVEEAVALESQTIKNMIKDGYTRIPLPNITSKILSKIIEYCKKHVQTSVSDNKTVQDDLKSLDAEFVKVDQGTLIDLIQTVANMIKGISSPEEIPNFFDIENDFTPDEEEAVRRENAWAFG